MGVGEAAVNVCGSSQLYCLGHVGSHGVCRWDGEVRSGMLAGGAKTKRESDRPVITALHTHHGDPVAATSSGYYFACTHSHNEGLSELQVCLLSTTNRPNLLSVFSIFFLSLSVSSFVDYYLLFLYLFLSVYFPTLV